MNFLLLPIQGVILIFLIFAISRAFLRLKEGKITFGAFLFWLGLWLLATVATIKPDFTTYLARLLGIGRGVDAVIYLSIVILFYLIFRTHVIIEDLRHEITVLTRKIALKGKK